MALEYKSWNGEKKRAYACLLLVVSLYLAIYSVILYKSEGLPYVMDNNESFSSLIHAKNMLDFGIADTLGLADEAHSPDKKAHPYIYTHGGNFPRLYVMALYVLGVRNIEGQIIVATFTVGLLGILFCFYFFRDEVNVYFAAIASVILMSDYILVAQWQVNTWRVWHTFFLFSSFLCVRNIYRDRGLWAWLAIVINFACVTYMELVFAVFCAIMAFLYTVYLFKLKLTKILKVSLLIFLGVLISVGTLVGQISAVKGWDYFKKDVYYTYLLRNKDKFDDQISLSNAKEFFGKEKIVFWHNSVDTSRMKNLETFNLFMATYVLDIVTPRLSFMVICIVIGVFLAVLARGFTRSSKEIAGKAHIRFKEKLAFYLGAKIHVQKSGVLVALFVSTAFYFLLSTNYMGPPPLASGGFKQIAGWLIIVILSGAAGYVWHVLTKREQFERGGLSYGRYAFAFAYLFAVLILASYGLGFFEQWHYPVWITASGPAQWYPLIALLLWITIITGLLLIAGTTEGAMTASGYNAMKFVCGYLFFGYLAIYFCFLLSPGTLYSAYFTRYCPFPVYITHIGIALTFYALGATTWRVVKVFLARYELYKWSASRASIGEKGFIRPKYLWSSVASGILAFGIFVLLAYMSFNWINLQYYYYKTIPPDQLVFMKQLRESPFRGSPFIVNTYSGPVFTFTGQWAFMDSDGVSNWSIDINDEIGKNEIDKKYLWLYDNDDEKYSRPVYYLCFKNQSYGDLYYRTMISAGKMEYLEGYISLSCLNNNIVKEATLDGTNGYGNEIVSVDHSYAKKWAIVKIKW